MDMQSLYLLVPLAPLAGAILAGVFGKLIGRTGAHLVTILGVAVALGASILIYQDVQAGHHFNGAVYTWMDAGGLKLQIGFLIDPLTVMMMLVVTFVSLMVHLYTIGYMADDPGYQRFFSYISLFTFSMLMLVMSNNFLQLFFGWEAVGLVSYLLIGFWYAADRDLCQPESFSGESRRRFRIPAGYRADRGLCRQPGLCRSVRQAPRTGGDDRSRYRLAADDCHLHLSVHRRDG